MNEVAGSLFADDVLHAFANLVSQLIADACLNEYIDHAS